MRANRLHDTISPPSIVCWSRPELISWCTARLMLMLGCGGRHTCILNCPLQSSRHHHPALPSWVAMMHPRLSAPWPDYEVCRALNVFSSKQLNFSPTTIKPWKDVETLDKCNSYPLKIPWNQNSARRRWNRLEMKICESFECGSLPSRFIFTLSKNFHGYESDSLYICWLLLRRQFLMKYGDVLNILKAK